MDAADLTPAEFLALDAQLHLALAEASGNVVIAAMMAGLRTAIESYVRAGIATDPGLGCHGRPPAAEHRAILGAIDAGEPARARTSSTTTSPATTPTRTCSRAPH